MTSTIKEYPLLYKQDKSDKTRIWKLTATCHNDSSYWIEVDYGQKDGKIVHTEKEVKIGKNIGKKNETTTEQQLILICDKTFKDKIEKEEYSQTENSIKTNKSFKPMLADKWNPESTTKRKIDITFPCFVQPKLDGIRCISYLKDSTIVNQSRQLKYFSNLHHINDELSVLFKEYPNIVFDGELYNHSIVFNKIAGIVKREKLKDDDLDKLHQIQYHIYDCFFDNNKYISFNHRLNILNKFSANRFKFVIFVDTFNCKDKDEVLHYHSLFVDKKYEGLILRNSDSNYEFTRSKHLQKYKTFEDDEFKIISFKEGEGNDKGTVIWKCVAKNGKEFEVRPIGTVSERSLMFKNGHKYIGKLLTVTYQELSEFGVPRFPVGKTIRDYE